MNMFLAKMANQPYWVQALVNTIGRVLNPILILVATAGIIYAIVVGVKFVKADNKDEREEAKQKLISVIIGIVVTFVLIALFFFLRWAIMEGKLDLSNIFSTGD